MFDAEQIRLATFARHVEIHDTLGSTNDRAAKLARSGDIELPALVVARHQTAGKGRGRNTWWSADGALTFSVLIDSASMGVLPANWPQLSLATAVAVCDGLRGELHQVGTSLGIKWPNDVLLDGGKVCGILVESPGGAAPAKNRLILGIGINVNNAWRAAPREAGASGTALCDVTGRQHNLQAVLVRVLEAMATRIAQLRSHDTQLIHDWQRLDLLAGRTIRIERDGRRIAGECRGIGQDGALIVDTAYGHHRIFSGTVRPSFY